MWARASCDTDHHTIIKYLANWTEAMVVGRVWKAEIGFLLWHCLLEMLWLGGVERKKHRPASYTESLTGVTEHFWECKHISLIYFSKCTSNGWTIIWAVLAAGAVQFRAYAIMHLTYPPHQSLHPTATNASWLRILELYFSSGHTGELHH